MPATNRPDTKLDEPTIHGEPFYFGEHLFAYTSIAVDCEGGAELEAYHLVPPHRFRGGEASEKNGWLHGARITHCGEILCLQGPPSVFVADPLPKRPYNRGDVGIPKMERE
jgi:hypothetical protein